MNEYDSGRMRDLLSPLGYQMSDKPDDADMVILNTCHIREKAAEKVYSDLGRLRPLKEAKADAGGQMIVAVAGCVAQAEGAEIMRRAPVVDMVFGPQAYHRLPEMVARAVRGADKKAVRGADEADKEDKQGSGLLDTDFPVESKFDFLPKDHGNTGTTAFLTIQEGCDKFCAFCVVPYTRGAEFSRPVADIVAEARNLAARGAREITLLGQNVNAYNGAAEAGGAGGTGGSGGGTRSLGYLLRRLADLDGLDRLRYTTSHPRDMNDDLIAAHRDVPQVMPYLHLPVQSGSDRILEAMNRRHTAEEYLRLVERIRDACPDIALSSDFIVGFPGESDADFAATMALVDEVGFAQAYSFKYSPRPGTPAALLDLQVAEDVKAGRLAQLQSLLGSQQASFNQATVGKNIPVLLDRDGRHPGQLVGRSPYLQAVHLDAPADLKGQIVMANIEKALANSLAGRLIGASSASADGAAA